MCFLILLCLGPVLWLFHALTRPGVWIIRYKTDSTMEKPSSKNAKAHHWFQLRGPQVVASSRPPNKAFLGWVKAGNDENGGFILTKRVISQ